MDRVILVLTLAALSLGTVLDGSRNPVVMLLFTALFTCLLAVRMLLPGGLFGSARSRRRLAMLVLIPMTFWFFLTGLQAQQLGIDSVDPYQSHIALYRGLGYIVTWLLFMSLFDSDFRFRLVAGVITLTALAQVVFGMLNYYGETSVIGWMPTHYAVHRVTGTYVNRNFFANLLVMATGFSLVWLMARRRYEGYSPGLAPTGNGVPVSPVPMITAALVILGLLFGGVLLSGSRGGLLSATLAAVLLLVLMSTMKGIRVSWRPLGFLFVAIAAVFGFGLMQLRLGRLGADSIGRLEQWRSTMGMIDLRPWTGYGAGAYETAFRNRQSGDLGPLTYNHAHNDFLQLILEQGVVGLLLVAVVILIPVLNGLWRAFDSRSVRRRRWILASLYGVSAMLFHAMVDSPSTVPANIWIFIAILAVLASATTIEYRRDVKEASTSIGAE